jgi:hypothetical protein
MPVWRAKEEDHQHQDLNQDGGHRPDKGEAGRLLASLDRSKGKDEDHALDYRLHPAVPS